MPLEVLREAEIELRAGHPGKASALLEKVRKERLLSTAEQRLLAVSYIRQGQRLKALSVVSRSRNVGSRLAVGQAAAVAYAGRTLRNRMRGGKR